MPRKREENSRRKITLPFPDASSQSQEGTSGPAIISSLPSRAKLYCNPCNLDQYQRLLKPLFAPGFQVPCRAFSVNLARDPSGAPPTEASPDLPAGDHLQAGTCLVVSVMPVPFPPFSYLAHPRSQPREDPPLSQLSLSTLAAWCRRNATTVPLVRSRLVLQ